MENLTIRKLNENNYSTWCEDIRPVLMGHNGWRITNGMETKPDDKASPKVLKDFLARKDKAFSLIYLSIEEELRPLLSEIEEPAEAWQKLQVHFRPDSRARIVQLTDEFFNCRIEPAESVGLYAARLKKIIKQLSDAGKPIAEWFQSFQLIRRLPAEFQGIVQSIYRWDDEKFKFQGVLEELLAEEARLKLTLADQAMCGITQKKETYVKGTNKGNKKHKNLNSRCFRCGILGHERVNCKVKISQRSKNAVSSQEVNTSFIMETCYSDAEKQDNRAWVIDTAATTHFCGNKDLFSSFKPLKGVSMTVALNDVSCDVEGEGTVDLIFHTKGRIEKIHLLNVLYSPKLRRNLIAGPAIDKGGGSFTCKNGSITVYHKDGRELFKANRRNDLYYCNPVYKQKQNKKPESLIVSEENSLQLWHRRFCHINPGYIFKTSKNESVRGMPKLSTNKVECESCRIAKTRRKSFKRIRNIGTTKPLELIHMDVCGPLPARTPAGHRYFLSIIDDFSKKVVVFPMKQKNEALNFFLGFQKRAERFTGEKIIRVRTDNGLEFIHKEFEKFFEEQGIRHERTNFYTPEQNGVAERFNYTAIDAVKTMLHDSGLSKGFWNEALLCFTYTFNRVCRGNQNKTPFELYSGRRPSVKHLRVFGSKAYVGMPRQLRSKFDMRTKKGILVGYAMKTKGYRIWLPDEHKIIETINVTFVECEERSGAMLDPGWHEYQRTVDEVSESESDEEGEPEVSSESTPEPKTEMVWKREAVPRKDGSRTDIFYRVEGEKVRLRSSKDAEKYCEARGIKFKPEVFNFSGKNKYSGEVRTGRELETPELNVCGKKKLQLKTQKS